MQCTENGHCIGAFDVPEWESIPEIDIRMETRKGCSYAIETIA